MTLGRYNAATASISGIYFVIAGGSPTVQSTTESAEIYNIVTRSWTYFRSALSSSRNGLASASYGNIAVFAGGMGIKGPTANIDLYDSLSNTWTLNGSLSVGRSVLVGATIGAVGFFAGGKIGNTDVYSDVVDTYSFATGV